MTVRKKGYEKKFKGALFAHDDTRNIFYNPFAEAEVQDGPLLKS